MDVDNAENTEHMSFSDIGLSEWLVQHCRELWIKTPLRVQQHCIPKILEGRHVIGIDETDSGKTAAFVLPILQRLAENPFGVFALVLTTTREHAVELYDHFRCLGGHLPFTLTVVVGGSNSRMQAKQFLACRPQVVIATPRRLKALLQDNPEIAPIFATTKFLVLDKAEQLLDVGFEEELKVIFHCLPENRQNLFFSQTMTSNLQKMCQHYQDNMYVFEAFEGLKSFEHLKIV